MESLEAMDDVWLAETGALLSAFAEAAQITGLAWVWQDAVDYGHQAVH